MNIIELLKVIVLGIVEGITEWLPISSTGHMILVDEFLKLNVTSDFKDVFLVVIQFGAILAVILLFFNKLWPFCRKKLLPEQKKALKRETGIKGKLLSFWWQYCDEEKWILWAKILVACLPAIVIGLPFDDFIEEHFNNYIVVAITLILYGIAFIVIENNQVRRHRRPRIRTVGAITFQTALIIGIFQVLALIPGTSRSGATIIGGILAGTSRVVAAEFTFYLAVPVMFGASLLKLVKFGFEFSSAELVYLIVGMVTAFAVSIFAIRFLMDYIKKHDFKVFGWYRIVLGAIVLIYFLIKTYALGA